MEQPANKDAAPTEVITARQVDGISFTTEPGINIDEVLASKVFTNWWGSVDRKKFIIRSVRIQSVDKFGPRVAFVKLKADVVDEKGKFVPGIIFMRGGSVAMLAVLHCEGRKYAIVTVQPRLPTGHWDFVEIPAGSLDDSGNFAGVAAKEIKEELGIEIAAKDLIELSALAGLPHGFFLSPGACEESMRLFYFEKEVSQAELADINGRCTGELEEGEQITVKVLPLDDLATATADAKTILAYGIYKLNAHLLAGPKSQEASEANSGETSGATA
jgi:ADP-sugar diphosphatase